MLYDVTSNHLESRCCELARFGYSRDGRRDKLQIVSGLTCAAGGCPIAIEVFDGDTGDPSTLALQIEKLERRFRLARVVPTGARPPPWRRRIWECGRAAGTGSARGARPAAGPTPRAAPRLWR